MPDDILNRINVSAEQLAALLELADERLAAKKETAQRGSFSGAGESGSAFLEALGLGGVNDKNKVVGIQIVQKPHGK